MNNNKRSLQTKRHCFLQNRDYNENMFYIYYLGRYRNKPIYTYGETTMIETVEFTLHKNLPFVKKITTHPVDHIVYGKRKFEDFIKNEKLEIDCPVKGIELQSEDFFTTSAEWSISLIKDITDELFMVYRE